MLTVEHVKRQVIRRRHRNRHTTGWSGCHAGSVNHPGTNQSRWFDTTTGRWISPDPDGFTAGDTNTYRYVGNSPANGTDPSGEEEEGEYQPGPYGPSPYGPGPYGPAPSFEEGSPSSEKYTVPENGARNYVVPKPSARYWPETSPFGLSQGEGPAGWGGEVLGRHSVIAIPPGSKIFASDSIPEDTARDVRSNTPDKAKVYENIDSWTDVIRVLDSLPNGSVAALVITGHGSSSGGVATKGPSWLTGRSLTMAQAAIINKKLKAGAPIIFLGCGGDTDDFTSPYRQETAAGLQKVANETKHPVIQNTQGVGWGVMGEGEWIRYQPE